MRVRLVLVGVEGEVNLGSAARLAANFAVDELYLVSPRASPHGEEARRYAVRAAKLLEEARIVEGLGEALEGVEVAACTSAKTGQDSDVLRHPVPPREFAETVVERGYGSVAVVFGRESVGLTREEIALCDVLVTIPASPEYPVLNLSHAVAIVLYELWLARSKPARPREAAPEALKWIRGLVEEAARLVVEEQRRSQVVAAMTHCLFKAGLTRGEASAIYYLFKRIVSRLKTPGGAAKP